MTCLLIIGGSAIFRWRQPSCISDGETPEKAILMGKDAVEAWLNTAKESGVPIPNPNWQSEELTI